MKSEAEREELNRKLSELNTAVVGAVEARAKWMNEHMGDFAIVQPGEMLYKRDGDNFIRLGIVRRLYRYHTDRDWKYDTSMDINYEYQSPAGSNCFDNTSRQGYLWLASEADREVHEQRKFAELKAKFEGSSLSRA